VKRANHNKLYMQWWVWLLILLLIGASQGPITKHPLPEDLKSSSEVEKIDGFELAKISSDALDGQYIRLFGWLKNYSYSQRAIDAFKVYFLDEQNKIIDVCTVSPYPTGLILFSGEEYPFEIKFPAITEGGNLWKSYKIAVVYKEISCYRRVKPGNIEVIWNMQKKEMIKGEIKNNSTLYGISEGDSLWFCVICYNEAGFLTQVSYKRIPPLNSKETRVFNIDLTSRSEVYSYRLLIR